MKAFNGLSLSQKLSAVIIAVSGCLLVASSLLFTLYTTFDAYLESERYGRSLAKVVANNATAAITFGDVEGGAEVLSALREEPGVTGSLLLTADGEVFARHGDTAELEVLRESLLKGAIASEWGRILFAEPIVVDSTVLGYTVLELQLDDLYQQVLRHAVATLVMLIGIMIIAIPSARRLARSVAEPLESLKSAMARVSAQEDFSARAAKANDDEVGFLVDQFNSMLDQLADRDSKLAEQRQDLERKVLDRTESLQVANDQLVSTVDDLRLAKDAAERASQAKGEFLANMSHEIRSPLNGVIGMAELLRKSTLSDRQDHFCRTILDSSKSLLNVLNDVLDFSKVEAGSLEIEHIDFSVNELVEATVQLFAEAAANKRLELICHVELGEELVVRSDPFRLRQILNNLVSNAIKFTDRGGVTLKLAELEGTSATTRLRFSVSDSGIGMTEEAMGRVFESFVQADGSTSRQYGGTGLGLTISKHLAELLGGTLRADSAAGEGSEFCLDVELVAVSRTTKRTGFDWKDKCVLIVDDNAHHLEILAAQLSNWGLQCDCVSTTDEVFARLREAPQIDLLLVDEELADNFGLTLLEAMREEGLAADARIALMVGVTALSDSLVDDRSFDHVLSKPIRPSDLFDCVNALLSERTQAGKPASKAENESTRKRYAGLHALVAEDNLVNQEVAEELLRDLGLQVAVVGDGQQALDHLMQQAVDMVFMDCQMPVMDGYAATRAIRDFEERSQRARTPIIALTANALQGDREKCLAAGMDDFLSKPFELEHLEAVVGKWLSNVDGGVKESVGEVMPAAVTLEPAAVERMRQIAVRKPGFAQLLVDSLTDDSAELSAALHTGLPHTAEQWDEVGFLAHKLKSALANVGAMDLAEVLRRLEGAAAEQAEAEFLQQRTGYQTQVDATLQAVQAAFADQVNNVDDAPSPDPSDAPALANVLLAEDDEPTRMLIAESLRQAGYGVTCAIDGEAALAELQRATPDVLLLDMLMPHKDGFEVLSEFRATPAGHHVPVIVMTGLDDGGSIHRAFEAGATDFLVKPVAIEVLVNRLRYILRTQHIASDLRSHQRRLRRAQDTAGVSFWEFNPDTGTFLLGEAVLRFLRLDPAQAEYSAASLRELVPAKMTKLIDAVTGLDAVTEPVSEFTVAAGKQRNVRVLQHMEEVIDHDSGERKFVGTVQDVTQLRSYERHVYELSHFDETTGLPKEAFLRRSLQLLISINGRRSENRTIAFLLIDVAEQQRVASVLGDRQRAQFVRVVAQRLEEYTRSSDLCCVLPDPDAQRDTDNKVAVLGTHRFAIILTEVASNRDVAAVCQRVIGVLSQPVAIDDHELYPVPAVGIAVVPDDGENYELLHQHASAALTQLLDAKTGGYRWYSQEQDQVVRQRLSLERDLRRAVERGEIEVFYQPRMDAQTLQPCALEALARWRRNGELVSPMEFIPIAEETGLINEIGEFVMLHAMGVLTDWQARLFPRLRISVNVSGQQFKTSDLPSVFKNAFERTGADPRSLEVEITEGVLLDSTDEVTDCLNRLTAMGIGLALDDFGTGFSSLAYLSRLPLDVLKIDRSFVAMLPEPRSQAIIRASVGLANELGLTVVAEGVETVDQLDWLKAAGCHELQGFFFARPMPTDECEAWLLQSLPVPDSALSRGEPRPPVH